MQLQQQHQEEKVQKEAIISKLKSIVDEDRIRRRTRKKNEEEACVKFEEETTH